MDGPDNISKEELTAALQEANAEIQRLQARVDEYEWLADALRRRTLDLSERTKELECLYGVADCLRDLDADVETMLQRIAEIIPAGYQSPRRTCASVTVSGRTFRSPGFAETACCQHARIMAGGRQIGNIRAYVGPDGKADESPPFLPEEEKMLEALAVWIGEAVHRRGTEQRSACQPPQ